MKKMTALIAAALGATACGPDIRDGVPSKEMVELKIPQNGSSTSPLSAEGAASANLQGETADTYVLTRAATVLVNGGTLFVLGLLEAITEYQPTTRTKESAVWGPYTDALSPNTWKLTVTHQGGQDYSYALEGKDKNADDSAYVAVLSGTHHAQWRKVGHGEFLIDWDAAQTLPEHDDNVGSAVITYANDGQDRAVSVLAQFNQVMDEDTQQRVDAKYSFESVPGEGGSFQFSVHKNANPLDGDTLEKFAIKSRWLQSGAGRSDVQVSEGDFATPALGNECWSTSFKSTYLNLSYDSASNYGVEADDCAIVGAEYADL